eukprot:tig00020710_g13396.t1
MVVRRRKAGGDGASSHGGGSQAGSWASSRTEAPGAIGEVRVALESVRTTIFGIALVAIKDTSRSSAGRSSTSSCRSPRPPHADVHDVLGLPGVNGNPSPGAGPTRSARELGHFLHDWFRFDGVWEVEFRACAQFTILYGFVSAVIWIAAMNAAYVGRLWSVLAYYPFFRLWMNQLRCASYAAFLWISIFMFLEGAADKRLRESTTPAAFYTLMILGIVPAGALGYYYCGFYYRRYLCTGRAYGLALDRAWHVEVATRFLEEHSSPRAVEIAENIFRRGLDMFPYSAVVRITSLSFLKI